MYDEVKNVEKVHDDLGQTNSKVCTNSDGAGVWNRQKTSFFVKVFALDDLIFQSCTVITSSMNMIMNNIMLQFEKLSNIKMKKSHLERFYP